MAENRKLKIAIYTICKNEAKFVDRWANSNKEADLRVVCDTGSTDDTAEKLRIHGVTVYDIRVNPWRFDVARGTALNLLPADIDICIWQDIDEELLPGWREQLENAWTEDTTIANHRYRNNGGNWQWHSKIHARHNCIWVGPVHEELRWSKPEKAVWIPELYLDEHQDLTKNRGTYLHLLLKKIQEGDKNWRTYAFLAGDYQRIGDWDNCIKYRHLSYEACNDGPVVKSYAAKVLGQCYYDKKDLANAERWMKRATEESDEKEAWFTLSEFYYNTKNWDLCYIAAKKCIDIKIRRDGFTQDHRAWSYLPYDYAALAAYNIGLFKKAVEFGRQAIAMNPEDGRLKTNLEFYEKGQ